MKQITRKLSILIASLLTLPVVSFVGIAAAGQIPPNNSTTTTTTSSSVSGVQDVCTGIGEAGGSSGCNDSSGVGLGGTLKNVISVMSILIGVIAVIMILVGGFKYVTSGGDTNKVNSGKDTIIYAMVGLVVAALAQVLVHFVLSTATK
jgi:hypothetical protein